MANTFLNKLSRNVTTKTTVGSYVVGASTQCIVVGLRITNVTADVIKVSAALNDGTNDHYLVGGATNSTMGANVPVGGSLVVINGDADKVVLNTGHSINVTASAAADVIMSVLEVTP